MTAPALTIRALMPDDLDAVTSLLSRRDGHDLAPQHVRTALEGLEPTHLVGWIAMQGDVPAGLTTLYVREQRWGDRTIRAGYWAHLYVAEEYRRLMVYPQLVLAMMRGVKPLGIDVIFTGTRRPHVAEGHVRLGFAKLGEYRVAYKPLRPFRLLARYKRWPKFVQTLGGVGDALYGALRGGGCSIGGVRFEELRGTDAPCERIAELLNADAATKTVRREWTPADLRRRLAGTIDGTPYHALLAHRGGQMIGAGVYRVAVRERVQAGIVMDICVAGEEDALRVALARAVESRLRSHGADTTLALVPPASEPAGLRRTDGHRVSKETYQMLVWPKSVVSAGSVAADLGNWRFTFLDHDAF